MGWRRYAWKRARKQLIGARVPLEIVRLRVRRAEELGLTYPQYAAILLGSGRDIVGFLFTVDGLSLRLARRLEMPEHVKSGLQALRRCERLALAPPEEPAEIYRAELEEVSGASIRFAAPAPDRAAGWGVARAALLAATAPLKAPSDAIVMIGGDDLERRWSEAARFAGFLKSDDYFPSAPPPPRTPVDSPAAGA